MSTVLKGPATANGLQPATTRPQRSRWLLVLLLLCLLVAVGVGFLIWQPNGRLAFRPTDWPTPTGPGAIPTYSNAQGAQDAPRSETMSGRGRDYDACMETLRLRRVVWETAKDTCTKMVAGLYGG